ncbi:heterokaryon incompatibility protein [Colletotrichum musicola]|uniref:Heterokaryon incompatibility protein n=1 Tax=Colletotrichum musicola TaxID=2175873 RepID=A0A8H6JNA5_9PEZI|nr:heterokaryon incompatibility protein [Colletotrichum musicola]
MQERDDDCEVCYGNRIRRFFIENAEPGCSSCQILSQCLRHFYPPEGPRGKVNLIPEHFPDGSPYVQISNADEDGSPAGIVFHVTREEDAQSVARNVGGFFSNLAVRRDIEEVPSGQSSIDQMATWIRRCSESHTRCRRETPRLPTRVIDVGTGDECRLYESHGEHAEYTALSHCWGKIRILTTLKKNIKDHANCIGFDALPKTFQEAIKTTRSLGVRYLWIDSLCIVQDDADDWAKESAQMASIYREAYLTLAATAANDGSEGLFKPRQVDTFSYTLSGTQDGSDGVSVRATKHRKHDCLRAVDDLSESGMVSLPLMTRAWCYQERILSSRILHFAADEMVWECQQATSCECDLLEDYQQHDWSKLTGGDPIAQEAPDRTLFRLPDMEKHWFRLIRNYTILNITKDFDRLPALSGIASSLIPAEEYMAGIRKARALEDLLWIVSTTTPPRRPDTYVAPSWSWASVMGNILHAHPWNLDWTRRPEVSTGLAEIKSISTVKSTVDQFGRVESGELRISGTYFKALVKQKDQSEIIGSTFGRHWLTMEIPDLPSIVWPKEVALDTIEDAREAIGQSVRVLAVWSQYGNISFLVLARQSLIPSRFRRIGLVEMFPFATIAGRAKRFTVEEILEKGHKGNITII